MRIRRADDNQPEVVAALRKAGAFVQAIHVVGNGCPDLLARIRPCTCGGGWRIMEVKDGSKPPSERRLTPGEAKWHAEAGNGSVAIVESPEGALHELGLT